MSHLKDRAEYNEEGKITALDLSGMGLSSLPPHVGQLSHLETLNLSRNQLTTLPPEITQLTNLQELDLSENELTILAPGIGRLTQLKHLTLWGNRLNTFPSELCQLSGLQSLDLSQNELTSLPPEVARLSKLEFLYLWDNTLTTLPPEIGQLTRLQHLYLSGNQLTVLPPEVGQLIHLQDLDVSDNRLKALPQEIIDLVELQSLELEGNPLRTPPPEIVARGRSDVFDFLGELARGCVTRYEAKLLIVGEAGTGKSSLLRGLRDEPFVEGLAPTHGIDIKPFSLPHPRQPNNTMTLNVWDFGGQQIYHTTHQFFMTKRSLYLLVWSARWDAAQARLDHWLRKIHVLAPKAPVVLVATHIDECPPELNYRRFKEAYPQLAGVVGVSNRYGTRIAQLKELLAREAANLPLMEQLWPKTWVAAERRLRESSRCHVSLSEYIELCVQQGVSDEIAQSALGGYLHDLGKILYYQDDNALSDFVVLKPNWLTRAISRALDDKPTRENGGVLAHADFLHIWGKADNGDTYERRLYPLFLRLMERYLISFKLENKTPDQEPAHSLIPLLLPHDPPAGTRPWSEVLPDQPEINMVFRLQNLVPSGLMSWFIVLTHRYSHGQHWREGVRLQYQDHQAEVVLNPSKRELWLRVRGPAPSNFFNILQHTINDRILDYYFEGLEYKREVPCKCHLDRGGKKPCPFFHDYERLVERMKRNKLTTECGECFDKVSVPFLLEGIHYTTDDRIAAKLERNRQALQKLARGQARIIDITSENRELLVQNAQMFEQLNRSFTRLWNLQMASFGTECPNIFLLTPSARNGFEPKKLFFTQFTLHLLCQYPVKPHIVSGEQGYPIQQPKEWWAALAPWLDRLMDFLRYIPRGRAVAEAYDDQFLQATQASIDIMEALLESQMEADDSEVGERRSFSRDRFRPFSAEGPALRTLFRYLKRLDLEERWCGLYRTPTNDGNILWLCDEHRKLFRSF